MLKKVSAGILVLGVVILFIIFGPLGNSVKISSLKKDKSYNLLLITMDTTRPDRLGCYGYGNGKTPNLDRLARQGVMYRNCYANVPITLPSHASIFTGRLPIAHAVRNNGTYVLEKAEQTLAELFKNAGFNTFAAVASFVLEAKFGLAQGFDTYDDALDNKTADNHAGNEITAQRVYGKFKSWLDKHWGGQFFSWVHFYDPHFPYVPPSPYKEEFMDRPYDGEIAYMDHYIGKIIDDLKERNLLENTVIVITADHGEAFGEHEEFGHTIFCYQENIKVPLIFYHPGIIPQNTIVERPVQLVDIMPTLLQLFGIRPPEGLQGQSLLATMTGAPSDDGHAAIYFESMHGKENMSWAPLTGIIENFHKYVSLPQPELYDLRRDPSEKENLYPRQKNSLGKKMDRSLRRYMLTHSGTSASGRRRLSAADKKRLESLGYLSTSAGKRDFAMNPKKGIVYFNRVLDATRLLRTRHLQAAEHIFNDLYNLRPSLKMTQLYDGLYALYLGKKDYVRLEALLKRAIRDFPDIHDYKVHLAKTYSLTGRTGRARFLCRSILDKVPSHTQANVMLAKLHILDREPARALDAYKTALQSEPLNHPVRIEYAEALLAAGQIAQVRRIIDQLSSDPVLMEAPESFDIKIRLSMLMLRTGQYQRVIELAGQLTQTERGHNDPAAWNRLGMAYFHQKKARPALEAYKTALNLDPRNPLTLSNMGTLYLTLFRVNKDKDFLDWSREHYQRALEAEPAMVSALNGLAVCHGMKGELKKAMEYWNRALDINPDFTGLYFNLAITNLKLGGKQKARGYLLQLRDRLFNRLTPAEQHQLSQLLTESSGG